MSNQLAMDACDGGTHPGTDETASVADLVAHIVKRFHEVHRAEFPAAIALARTVERVHAGDPLCPTGLADHLAMMLDVLESHQRREEVLLFPMLMSGGCAAAIFPIRRMVAEHEDVEHQLAWMARLTRDFSAPEGADAGWRALYRACRKLKDDLNEHMRLENDELFARFTT